MFPKHRADLLEAAVVSHRMQHGLIESTRFLRNPLDVLAQQIVAMCAMDDWPIDKLAEVMNTKHIVDGRNLLDRGAVRRRGFTYQGIGRS